MASQARAAFDKNAKDIERLIKIHADVGGDEQGRRYGLEVLNKSAVILITAIWEAYCEDIAAEALEHLVNHVPSASQLPKELKKKLVTYIKSEPNELAMWDLAGDGWKAKVQARFASLTTERNRRLNTPKTQQIDELFAEAVGLTKVSTSWNWKKMSAKQASKKLDDYITLRGEIAHRAVAAAQVKKIHVTNFFGHVKRLVGKTGGAVNLHVKTSTGQPLW